MPDKFARFSEDDAKRIVGGIKKIEGGNPGAGGPPRKNYTRGYIPGEGGLWLQACKPEATEENPTPEYAGGLTFEDWTGGDTGDQSANPWWFTDGNFYDDSGSIFSADYWRNETNYFQVWNLNFGVYIPEHALCYCVQSGDEWITRFSLWEINAGFFIGTLDTDLEAGGETTMTVTSRTGFSSGMGDIFVGGSGGSITVKSMLTSGDFQEGDTVYTVLTCLPGSGYRYVVIQSHACPGGG